MPRLLGRLAQFSAFSKQGELLCTQALVYLLRHPAASEAFKTHFDIGALGALKWHAERMQQDRGRPDLEGCDSNDKPVIKIEGKLGALLSEGQLQSYVADFDARGSSGMLLVLVPRYRLHEAQSLSTKAFGLTGPGPSWVLAERGGCVVRVACWDEILDVLSDVSQAAFSGDLAQFNDLYRALNGDIVEPLAPSEDWREREAQYLTLIDKATRQLAPQNEPINPIGLDVAADPHSYRRRYVCRPHTGRPTCFSLGLRDPFPEATGTPVWLRFHKDTGDFSGIRARLEESNFGSRIVQHDGHMWLPIEVPSDETDGHALSEAIATECSAILRLAWPGLTRASENGVPISSLPSKQSVQPANSGDSVMNSINEELRALGFHRAGTVYPDGGQCRVEIDWDLDGFAIYAMVVGNVIMKFGTTGRKNSRLKSRMLSTFSALRQTIKKGPPYVGDPFKTHGPAPILENKKIELWAKPSTEAGLEIEESELNNRYRPEWTKEGR